MLRFACDENFNNVIVRSLQNRVPELDLVRLQDTEIAGADDNKVLEWVAANGRILLTHDLRTIPRHFYERMNRSEPVPGVFAVPDDIPPGQVAADLELLVKASQVGEWDGKLLYLPL